MQTGIHRYCPGVATILMLLMLLGIAGCASREPPPPQFSGFIQAQTAPVEPWSAYPGVTVRRLSGDEFTGRSALHLTLPLGWRWSGLVNDGFSREWFVLQGRIQAGERQLRAGDLLYVPAGAAPPAMTAVVASRMLVFTDPADSASGLDSGFVASSDALSWRAGTVARDAGVPLDLSVKDLKRDPGSGARTWLVKVRPGVAVPWESHSVVEEGYLLEGTYRLSECLPEGRRDGEYLPGGYFRRPAGWIHSGPDSGTDTGAVWLMRTPGPLDVRFHDACLPPPEADG
ncbi:MAG: cupin domain-containing protein [Gammaproteobacteria bacterium]